MAGGRTRGVQTSSEGAAPSRRPRSPQLEVEELRKANWTPSDTELNPLLILRCRWGLEVRPVPAGLVRRGRAGGSQGTCRYQLRRRSGAFESSSGRADEEDQPVQAKEWRGWGRAEERRMKGIVEE
mmetsp:Transcript_23855/g.77661  ORF Transcript_23855/g.77661 Transcript_23855/m.77661 type:complete len:126 (+) Transcript_23855:1347-1724(+)